MIHIIVWVVEEKESSMRRYLDNHYKVGKRVYYVKGDLVLNSFIKTIYRNNSVHLQDGSLMKIRDVYGNKNDAVLAMKEQLSEAKRLST